MTHAERSLLALLEEHGPADRIAIDESEASAEHLRREIGDALDSLQGDGYVTLGADGRYRIEAAGREALR